jgi:hypothetical protein
LSVGAARSAVASYERLLNLSPPDDVVIRVTIRQASLVGQLAQAPESVLARIADAIALAEAGGRVEDILQLRAERGVLVGASGGDVQEALAELREVRDACLGNPDRVHLLAFATRGIGSCAQTLGDATIASDAAQRALEDIERYGDDGDFASHLQVMSMHSGLAGYRRLTSLIRGAASSLLAERDPRGRIALLNYVASLFNDRPVDAWTTAMEGYRRSATFGLAVIQAQSHLAMLATILATPEAVAEARRQIGNARSDGPSALSDWEAYLAAGSAVLAWQLGDAEMLLPAVDSEADTSDPVANAWWHMREAAVSALAEATDDAVTHAAAAVHRMADLGLAHEDMPPCYGFAVDVLLTAGATAELEELTTRFESLSMGQRFNLMHGLLLRARAMLSPDPRPGLAEAIDVFDGMGAAFPAATARIDLAERLLGDGSTAEATQLLDSAERALSAISAKPSLERIDRLRQDAVISVA